MLLASIEVLWHHLLPLLYLFWSLSSFAAVAALLPLSCLRPFRNAVFLSACRGKLWEDRPKNALGILTGWRVPQAWFAHFYDVGVLASTLCLWLAHRHYGMSQGVLLMSQSLLQLHLVRRCLETHFMMRYPAGASMHAIAYVFGLVYYIALPLTCLPAEIFSRDPFTSKSSDLAYAKRASALVNPNASPNARQTLGATIFLLGNSVQFHSHWILARLSRQRNVEPSTHTYCLPSGGAFQLVSCPHYLGEMIIYLGLTMTLDVRRVLAWLPLSWVVANLLLASGPTHAWYKRKFEGYPKERKAVIPFVY